MAAQNRPRDVDRAYGRTGRVGMGSLGVAIGRPAMQFPAGYPGKPRQSYGARAPESVRWVTASEPVWASGGPQGRHEKALFDDGSDPKAPPRSPPSRPTKPPTGRRDPPVPAGYRTSAEGLDTPRLGAPRNPDCPCRGLRRHADQSVFDVPGRHGPARHPETMGRDPSSSRRDRRAAA
jgi:hypothetical protein